MIQDIQNKKTIENPDPGMGMCFNIAWDASEKKGSHICFEAVSAYIDFSFSIPRAQAKEMALTICALLKEGPIGPVLRTLESEVDRQP